MKTEAGRFVFAPVLKDYFDTQMMSKIIAIILFLSQRYITNDVYKVFVK